MLNVLVVSDSGKDTYNYKFDEVSYISLGTKNSLLMRVIYRALYISGLVYLFYVFKFRHTDFQSFDVILLNETRFPVKLVKFLSQRKQHAKVLYWFWNTVGKPKNPRFFDSQAEFKKLLDNREKYNYSIVSFDEQDCRKYGFIYNPQCVPFLNISNKPTTISSDVFFVGQDKNRIEMLMDIYKEFDDLGIKCNFYVFPQADKKYTTEEIQFVYRGPMLSYEHVVEKDMQSRAILDIVQEGQGGLTWRPIESIFYNKKLITNFKGIKNFDFYCKGNIFILGQDNIGQLKSFLDAPFHTVPESVKDRYTLKGSLRKIVENLSK